MPTKTTSSFITEIPIQVDSHALKVLKKRFFAAKQQYNALLGEALKRLKSMKEDQSYQKACQIYKDKSTKYEAKALFKQLASQYQYGEYDLYAYTKQWNTKANPLSIGARISQKLAKRAFQAVAEYKAGKRGKPRFKGLRGINSIEDNSINANIRLKDTTIHYLGLQLPLRYNIQDPIHCHGLHSPIKYIRLVKRTFNTKTRYFAQLICQGKPWKKSKDLVQKGTVGLDIGPQTIAIVSPHQTKASLQVFADELQPHKTHRKKLQQKLARQLRASNPTCYKQDAWQKKDKNWKRKKGTSIKGKKLTKRSKSLQKTVAKLATTARRQAAFRKTQHGKLINQILSQGNHIKFEKLSYKAFQKLYGSSVGLRAPGMFVELLKRKAENAGGKVEEINPYKTKLSQTCHCGIVNKKTLRQRWHICACGVEAQRDLYSAYLASFVEKDKLMVDQAKKAWSGMDIALSTAMSDLKRSRSKPMPASLGLKKPGSENVVRTVS